MMDNNPKRLIPHTDNCIPRLTLRKREAAKALGICERTLHEITKNGDIPHFRIGRAVIYPISGLNDWINSKAKQKGGEV